MKKIILLLSCLLAFCSCEKEAYEENIPQEIVGNDGVPEVLDTQEITAKITELYGLNMRGRVLPYPFHAYIIRLSNGRYYYAYRNELGQDLHVGDVISQIKTHPTCSQNIIRISVSSRGSGITLQDSYAGYSFSDYVLASSPYEDDITTVIELPILAAATLPINNYVLVTNKGHLVYGKTILFGFKPEVGQHVVYSVLLAYKSEINAIKILD